MSLALTTPSAALSTVLGAGSAALRQLFAFSQHRRLVSLRFLGGDAAALQALTGPLVVEQAQGREQLDAFDGFTVDVLSPTADLDLAPLIGTEAGLSVLCADDRQRHWYGLVTQVANLEADGGLARYRLTLSPWPAILALREDSHVFQEHTTLDTIEALLADYPLARYELRVSPATRAALTRHPTRTQFRETDLAFLQRLLAAEGLSSWVEHDATPDSAAGLHHTLVIADADTDWAPLSPERIRYRRLSAAESEDAIHGLIARQHITSNATHRSGWNAALVAATSGQDRAAVSDGIPLLEDHDGDSDPAQPQASSAAAQRAATLRLQAHQALARVYTGESSVRTLAPGRVFTLAEHPDLSTLAGLTQPLTTPRLKVRAVEHHLSNNLHLGLAGETALGERGTYRNHFTCVPYDTPQVPALRPAPTAPGLLTALVVGVADQAATTHRNAEVRVQFHWQRGASPNSGGLSDTGWPQEAAPAGNAPGNETAGTWVRVAQSLAGPDWGSVFVPRIGTEVLVSFERGDIDRPLIVGCLHNGLSPPPFAAGEGSPLNHPGVISGIHTRVLQAPGDDTDNGYNQLVFDDAPGQLGAQLASSTQMSQLNLGSLIARCPGSAERGVRRGEGAELTTSAWAVLRAQQGALISATAQPQSQGPALHAAAALGQLQGAIDLTQRLNAAAQGQGNPPLSSPKDLQQLIDTAKATQPQTVQRGEAKAADIAAYSQPILLQETPASVGLTTPASAVHYASQGLHLIAQSHLHLSAGQTLNLSSGRDTTLTALAGGISAIAANGAVSVQAQTGELQLLADDSVTVTSTDGTIEVSAKQKIVLQAGECSITLDGPNITLAMPGALSVKGGKELLGGGGKGQARLPVLPTGEVEFSHWIALDYRDPVSGAPMAAVSYEIIFQDGSTLSGQLDGSGKARHDNVEQKPVQEVIYKPRVPQPEVPHPDLNRLLA